MRGLSTSDLQMKLLMWLLHIRCGFEDFCAICVYLKPPQRCLHPNRSEELSNWPNSKGSTRRVPPSHPHSSWIGTWSRGSLHTRWACLPLLMEDWAGRLKFENSTDRVWGRITENPDSSPVPKIFTTDELSGPLLPFGVGRSGEIWCN